mmetsp:Transcript_1617/g.4954  ORF Transcript_1617/g.4954 Transcript_1617/m.4954 type:complete len:265 (-) Transcript_1617:908-1702(-)
MSCASLLRPAASSSLCGAHVPGSHHADVTVAQLHLVLLPSMVHYQDPAVLSRSIAGAAPKLHDGAGQQGGKRSRRFPIRGRRGRCRRRSRPTAASRPERVPPLPAPAVLLLLLLAQRLAGVRHGLQPRRQQRALAAQLAGPARIPRGALDPPPLGGAGRRHSAAATACKLRRCRGPQRVLRGAVRAADHLRGELVEAHLGARRRRLLAAAKPREALEEGAGRGLCQLLGAVPGRGRGRGGRGGSRDGGLPIVRRVAHLRVQRAH